MSISFASAPAKRTWRKLGLCKNYDAKLFFPNGVTDEETRPAKEICANCPVRAECLSYALEANESDGIWGGLDKLQRRQLRKRMAKAANRGHQFKSVHELINV